MGLCDPKAVRAGKAWYQQVNTPGFMSGFPVGAKVNKTAGVRLTGVVIPKVYWRDCDDGTYKAPAKTDVCVLWSDGTKGYAMPQWLEVVHGS